MVSLSPSSRIGGGDKFDGRDTYTAREFALESELCQSGRKHKFQIFVLSLAQIWTMHSPY